MAKIEHPGMDPELEKMWLQIKDLAADIQAKTVDKDKEMYQSAIGVWDTAMEWVGEDES